MTTCKGQHELLVIHCCGSEMEERVVRCCRQCGAVCVDIDTDGRTAPGAIMKMQLPLTEKKKQDV